MDLEQLYLGGGEAEIIVQDPPASRTTNNV